MAQGKVFSTGIEKFIEDSDLIISSSTRGNPQTREVHKYILWSSLFMHVYLQVQGGEVKELSALAMSGMSARERNRAKRKARQLARRNSRESNTPEKV